MDEVTLRTGVEVPRPLVQVMAVALRHAFRDDPVALVDAVEMAHTGQPQPFSAARLESLGFTQQGVMHDATRDVILAATEGRGFEIRLVSPLAVADPAGVVIPRGLS